MDTTSENSRWKLLNIDADDDKEEYTEDEGWNDYDDVIIGAIVVIVHLVDDDVQLQANNKTLCVSRNAPCFFHNPRTHIRDHPSSDFSPTKHLHDAVG